MIFVHDKIFAKVWDIKRFEKYSEIRISTSEKKLGTESEYINSNWSFVRCIGHAHNTLQKVDVGDRITITLSKLTNEMYVKDGQKRSAFRFLVLEIGDVQKANKSVTAVDDPDVMPY